MKTLTRNVISLWDEISTPRQDNTSLFSQSEELLSSSDPKILHITSADGSATRSIRRAGSTRRKSQRRLLFDDEENNTKSGVLNVDSSFPFHAISSNKFNKSYGAAPWRIYRHSSFGLRDLLLPAGLKNYTFPLYVPVKPVDTRVPLLLRALNLSVRWKNSISNLQNRNNNSYSFLRAADSGETNDLCTQIKEDTQEFENDINFLSTVANKTSTPIKAVCPKIQPNEYTIGQTTSVGAYARLAEGLTRIFTSKSDVVPTLSYCGTYQAMKDIQHLSPFRGSDDTGFTLINKDDQERRTPRFASEDEEAVYYLITKYLED